jgi:hypothetical protein
MARLAEVLSPPPVEETPPPGPPEGAPPADQLPKEVKRNTEKRRTLREMWEG